MCRQEDHQSEWILEDELSDVMPQIHVSSKMNHLQLFILHLLLLCLAYNAICFLSQAALINHFVTFYLTQCEIHCTLNIFSSNDEKHLAF